MAISVDNLRKGKKYRLTNYGEQFDFQVMDMPDDEAYLLKDLNTLDIYYLQDLIKFGKGRDFDLDEI
jgi:hypothetical protein